MKKLYAKQFRLVSKENNMSIYLGEFDNKKDVENAFRSGSLDLCHILLASYEYGDYCGDAFVLFVENGRLYEVHGSHCSCYGLEDQWDPEETMFAALKHRIEHGNLSNLCGGYEHDVLKQLEELGFND